MLFIAQLREDGKCNFDKVADETEINDSVKFFSGIAQETVNFCLAWNKNH